jgi:hypothetical protein
MTFETESPPEWLRLEDHLPAKARRTGSEGNPETGSGPFVTSRSPGEKTGDETGSLTEGTGKVTGGKTFASGLVAKSLRKVSKRLVKLRCISGFGLGMSAQITHIKNEIKEMAKEKNSNITQR